ncbi:MAG: glycosyl hydrolase 53 family protein [Hominilimicola sp.]
MKKLLIAMAVMALCSTAAYAQSVDLNGDVSEGKKIEVTGLADGYYDLTVMCKNDMVDENTYMYGLSEDYTISSTVLPKSDEGVKVTVKGIGVTDGKCEIGVVTSGKNKIEFSDADLAASKANKFITGGDMTEVSYIEDLGGVYKDENGNAIDVFEYLAANGMNMARIRLSNTTGKGTGDGTYYLPEGYQDEADCLKLAKRAKDAGMGIQFTFNYSDYWSNGERQIIPSEWVKQIKEELGYDVKDPAFLNAMTDEQKKEIQYKLGDIVYNYTFDIMTKLKKQGTVPEYVSLGNEINGGMFFPFANTFDATMDKDSFELIYSNTEEDDIKCYKDWEGLANILNRGYDAVKAVSPESQVVIHLANGSKDSVFTWFFDAYNNAGGKFDVIGASYYPAWSHNPIETCVSFCNTISEKYDKDILIMETGYNWTENKKNGYGGQLTPTADDEKNAPGYTEKYPFTADGHKGFMADLINALKGVDNGRCIGLLYWDPCMIHVEDSENPNESLSGWANRESDDKPDGNVVENTTLFDFDGKAIPTVGVFRNSRNSEKAMLSGGYAVTEENGAIKVTVKNNYDTEKKVNLYVFTYGENGLIKAVKIDSERVGGKQEANLELEIPKEEFYRVFLWNGANFAPIK